LVVQAFSSQATSAPSKDRLVSLPKLPQLSIGKAEAWRASAFSDISDEQCGWDPQRARRSDEGREQRVGERGGERERAQRWKTKERSKLCWSRCTSRRRRRQCKRSTPFGSLSLSSSFLRSRTAKRLRRALSK